VRLAGDYLALPALGVAVVLVAREVIDAHYTPLGLYCWKGMGALRLVCLAYLGVVGALGYGRGRSRGWSAGATFAVVWNLAATFVVTAVVYADAVVAQACNE
jgi:hypothetical protein